MSMLKRTYIPGSEWFYVKIYTGIKSADKILINNISPIIHQLIKENIIEKWFFIRYTDPDFHLRIRAYTKDKCNIVYILNLFYTRLNALNKDNLVWKIQVDTYNRELERYGYSLITYGESIFHIDSNCILSILKCVNKTKNEHYRWMVALKLVDSFLSDFSFTLEQKLYYVNKVSNAFRNEFGYNEFNSKQLNEKYRILRPTINGVLDETKLDEVLSKMNQYIIKRSKELNPLVTELKRRANKLNININFLLSSYIHMMINRLFCSKNRLHELMIYDLLTRHYKSELARKKYDSYKINK